MNHLFIDEFPGIMSYPIGVVGALCNLIVEKFLLKMIDWLDSTTAGFAMLSMSAEMFDLGCSFIDSWSLTKQKDYRRILRSMPVTEAFQTIVTDVNEAFFYLFY